MEVYFMAEPTYGLSEGEKSTAHLENIPMYDVTLKTLKYCNYL